MNYTLHMISELAWRYQKKRLRTDEAWGNRVRRQETLFQAFKDRYAQNPGLLHQVIDLADAAAALAEYESEYRFYLGLQMGLDLGGLDLGSLDLLEHSEPTPGEMCSALF